MNPPSDCGSIHAFRKEPAIATQTDRRLHGRRERGGLAIHVAVTATTLLVLVVAVFAVVRSYQRNQVVHRRKALQVCEDGLMAALEQLSQTPSWREGIARTEHGGGWYEVSVSEVDEVAPPRIEILATGTSGGVTRRQTSTLELQVAEGDSAWVQVELHEH